MMPVANSGAKMTATLITRVLGVSALAATGLTDGFSLNNIGWRDNKP